MPFTHPTDAVERVSLDAHLSHNFMFTCRFGECTCFGDCVTHRFLQEDVLAHFDRHHGGGKVHMVGGSDGNRVNLLIHFHEHHAEVLVLFCIGKLSENFIAPRLVHIAKRHNILRGDTSYIYAALSTDTDAGDVQLTTSDDIASARGNVIPGPRDLR